ncbi:MAG: methyl-accepting chemotaxis protein, partial [Roseicyclus sp.]
VVDATARRDADASGRSRDGAIRDRTSAMTNEVKPVLELLKTLKILAINARVEAARAGDAGRGFTVVAREVGELAAKSDSRARTIADLTKELSALLDDESGRR